MAEDRDDFAYFESRLAAEEHSASTAPSTEAACRHRQLAMLYRAQLALLKRARERAGTSPPPGTPVK